MLSSKRSLVLRKWTLRFLFVIASCLPELHAALRDVWYRNGFGCWTRRNLATTDVVEPFLGYRSSARSDVKAIRLTQNGITGTLPRSSHPLSDQGGMPLGFQRSAWLYRDAWCMLILDPSGGIRKVRTDGPFSSLLMSQPTTGSHTNLEGGVCIVTTRNLAGVSFAVARGTGEDAPTSILVLVLADVPWRWPWSTFDYRVRFRELIPLYRISSVHVEADNPIPLLYSLVSVSCPRAVFRRRCLRRCGASPSGIGRVAIMIAECRGASTQLPCCPASLLCSKVASRR